MDAGSSSRCKLLRVVAGAAGASRADGHDGRAATDACVQRRGAVPVSAAAAPRLRGRLEGGCVASALHCTALPLPRPATASGNGAETGGSPVELKWRRQTHKGRGAVGGGRWNTLRMCIRGRWDGLGNILAGRQTHDMQWRHWRLTHLDVSAHLHECWHITE